MLKVHKKTGISYGQVDGIYYKLNGTICHFDKYTVKHRLRDATENEEYEWNNHMYYSGNHVTKSSIEIKLHEVKPEIGKYYRFRFRHYDVSTESLIYLTKVKYDYDENLWYMFGIKGKFVGNTVDRSITEFNHLPITKYYEDYHEGTTLDEISKDEFFKDINESKFNEVYKNASKFILE